MYTKQCLEASDCGDATNWRGLSSFGNKAGFTTFLDTHKARGRNLVIRFGSCDTGDCETCTSGASSGTCGPNWHSFGKAAAEWNIVQGNLAVYAAHLSTGLVAATVTGLHPHEC